MSFKLVIWSDPSLPSVPNSHDLVHLEHELHVAPIKKPLRLFVIWDEGRMQIWLSLAKGPFQFFATNLWRQQTVLNAVSGEGSWHCYKFEKLLQEWHSQTGSAVLSSAALFGTFPLDVVVDVKLTGASRDNANAAETTVKLACTGLDASPGVPNYGHPSAVFGASNSRDQSSKAAAPTTRTWDDVTRVRDHKCWQVFCTGGKNAFAFPEPFSEVLLYSSCTAASCRMCHTEYVKSSETLMQQCIFLGLQRVERKYAKRSGTEMSTFHVHDDNITFFIVTEDVVHFKAREAKFPLCSSV